MEFEKCLSVGKIVKPVGIKGLVKVISLSDFPDKFFERHSVFLYDEKKRAFAVHPVNKGEEFRIKECRAIQDTFRVGFEGYNSINDVQDLIGCLIMIDEKDKAQLPEGRYYYYELIGLEVLDKGEKIGRISEVVDYGSGDLLKVDSDGKEVLIPFRDEFVKLVDMKSGRVEVDLIDGFR
ncbi:MAG: ribosome maturation factor RimM [Ignavibacteria bacterium]|nr:ribosome maturation factor RimM [Ignavibacteria bacterium]